MKHAIFFAALLLGCGPTPTEQCETFVGTFCGKAKVCTSLPVATCKDSVDAVIPCGKAVDVSASYDECLSDLDRLSCATVFPDGITPSLPANCKSVVLLK